MEPSEHHDRLIDTLLEEFVGGGAPPDLTGRIVARAFTRERRGRRTRAIVAAAAVLAIALFTWLSVRTGYPRPKAFGDCEVVGGGALRRGATVQAGHDYGTLRLGGYCRVDLDPEAVVRIEGGGKAEQVFLVRGRVMCEVDREAGAFAVRTEVGTAAVTGTRFSVQLVGGEGGKEMRRMLVSVLAGAVLVSGAWGELVLHAGETGCVPKRKAEADKPPEKPKVTCLVGTIKSVDPKAQTLVLTTGKGDEARDVTLKVCPRAAIKVNGKDAELAAVKVGAAARVGHIQNKKGELVAVRLAVGARSCPKKGPQSGSF